MSEHKILSIIEEMAQNGEVMTEAHYKKIADLLMKTQQKKGIKCYKITYLKMSTFVDEVITEDDVPSSIKFGNRLSLDAKTVHLDDETYSWMNERIQNSGVFFTEPKIGKYDVSAHDGNTHYSTDNLSVDINSNCIAVIRMQEYNPEN